MERFPPCAGCVGGDRPGTAPAAVHARVHATVRGGNYALSTGAMNALNLRRRL